MKARLRAVFAGIRAVLHPVAAFTCFAVPVMVVALFITWLDWKVPSLFPAIFLAAFGAASLWSICSLSAFLSRAFAKAYRKSLNEK